MDSAESDGRSRGLPGPDRSTRYRSHLFTVRLWQEEVGGGLTEWRGKVQHVTSGETLYFHDWETILAFLQETLDTFTAKSEPYGEKQR